MCNWVATISTTSYMEKFALAASIDAASCYIKYGLELIIHRVEKSDGITLSIKERILHSIKLLEISGKKTSSMPGCA